MTTEAVKSTVGPGALLSVAYAKSLYDEKGDRLGMFMPLVADVLGRMTQTTFTVADVQEQLAHCHQIAMPQNAVTTLLHRATKKGLLVREHGAYKKAANPPAATPIESQKNVTQAAYIQLSRAFREHAARRKLTIESDDDALKLLMQFLEEQHVGLLLGAPLTLVDLSGTSRRAIDIAAEFVQQSLKADSDLRATINSMVEALVLYRVAFLPDASASERKFTGLRVYFDSGLVRQALGYEGTALQALASDTLNVLKGSGVQCFVFDKTVDEIRRILALYENKLATEQGRLSLRPVPMARHFLTKKYSPADVREMIALLDRDIHSAGLQIAKMPKHEALYTFDEKKLAQYLTDPAKGDELEPRVLHDVDCVAGVLTFRRGKRSVYLEDASAIFVSASSLMLRNVRRWYREEDQTAGIDPAIHIRALSNQAWLKKPTLVSDFKIHELMALCAVALRPSAETWDRFRRHLKSLQESQRITSDEVTAVVISALSDRLLLEAELDDGDDDDVDATTLDDIVERVKNAYAEKANAIAAAARVEAAQALDHERDAIARADQTERTAAERFRRAYLELEGRARRLAGLCANGAYGLVAALLLIGAVALVWTHPFHPDWTGIVVGLALVVFVFLETLGILNHARHLRDELEGKLTQSFGKWLGLEEFTKEAESNASGPTDL